MFTGITEKKASILEQKGSKMTIKRPKKWQNLQLGQSILVSGVCLTVVDFDNESMSFDLTEETLERTTLNPDRSVNLERAMPAQGRFEGHLVQGHVDGTTTLLARTSQNVFTFALPKDFAHFLTAKGSIALNGVSLTISSLTDKDFSVAFIPHTLELTNFGEMPVGEKVNFECDIFAKLLYQWQKK